MEKFAKKYEHLCKERHLKEPNHQIVNALKISQKVNQVKEQGFVLNLSGCNLSATDCTLLAKCISSDRYFEEFHFSDCLLSEECCQILVEAFSYNKNIQLLDLKGNNLRYAGSNAVGKLLKQTTSLEELSLEWNTLGMWDNGITDIAEGLAVNQSLRILNMSNNQISHEGCTQIAAAVRRNKFLSALDLRWNNVGVMGGRALLASLAHNKYLINLQLAGNNIPNDALKAINTAIQRNVDYHTIFDEHRSTTETLHNELQYLEEEKARQVLALSKQLQEEKILHESLSESTRDRVTQMKNALDDLKQNNAQLWDENKYLEQQFEMCRKQVKECEQRELDHKSSFESLLLAREEEIKSLKSELVHEKANVKAKDKHISILENQVANLKTQILDHIEQKDNLIKSLKNAKVRFEHDLGEMNNNKSLQIEQLSSTNLKQTKTLEDKLQRSLDDKDRYQEEIANLKSNILADKLKHEEIMVSTRTKWNQDDAVKCKQYEERIQVLVTVRDDLQTKVGFEVVKCGQLENKLTIAQKDAEALKQQLNQLQQMSNQSDLEYRNEINRMNIQLDSEKRTVTEYKNKLESVEHKNQQAALEMRELRSAKDAEIAAVKGTLKSASGDLRRHREDEIRRVGILETAFQSYISSSRSALGK